MKICISALPLIIWVILQIGVSSSIPSPPPSQPTSPIRNQETSRPYQPKFKDRAVFDRKTGELVAIFYKQRRLKMSDMVFEEKDPGLIPDYSWLCRRGSNGLHGQYFKHKVYHARDLHYTGDTIEPQRNDLVTDPTWVRITGIFRDDDHYYEIARRITHPNKWVLT